MTGHRLKGAVQVGTNNYCMCFDHGTKDICQVKARYGGDTCDTVCHDVCQRKGSTWSMESMEASSGRSCSRSRTSYEECIFPTPDAFFYCNCEMENVARQFKAPYPGREQCERDCESWCTGASGSYRSCSHISGRTPSCSELEYYYCQCAGTNEKCQFNSRSPFLTKGECDAQCNDMCSSQKTKTLGCAFRRNNLGDCNSTARRLAKEQAEALREQIDAVYATGRQKRDC
eukprot:TRINITY_DN8673_c0_g2_i1.p1 TRINITY_DN8673_c0_g2~~TRINITY_DN8673_c0_g2_i1.p1  ORF type:complete len:245 (-),score=13.60 TRINITY_DN8673_c0_g2_i1:402-1091(-)